MDDEHHHHGEGLTLLRELYDANIQEAVRRIAAIMADATGGAPLKPKDMSQLEKTVTLAAQLGLQFGVHTGKLELTCPQQRAVVVISKEFNDHRDGAIHRGSSVRVDIVPEPGLNRLGNGTGDVDERVPLLPCMIVTLSS
jgi:hypothetical protein